MAVAEPSVTLVEKFTILHKFYEANRESNFSLLVSPSSK
jgi:hypothetical protein